MTDERRTPPEHPTGGKPDELVALYREGVADDAGPSAQSRERVLAYAREQADKRAAGSQRHIQDGGTRTPASGAPKSTPREAANDRRWLRHALGTFAMVGLVGWLTMQHLDQPGAPRLESSSSPAIQSAPTAEKQAPSESDTHANMGRAAPADAQADAADARAGVAVDAERKMDSSRQKQEAAKPAARTAPSRDAAPEPRAEQPMPAPPSAPAPAPAPAPIAAPAPAPAPAPSPAPAMSADESRPAAVEGLARQRGASAEMRSTAPNAAKEKSIITEAPAIKPLPECEASMDAQAQAEQARRIKLRDEAQAAGKPWRGPAPICRPTITAEPEPAQGSAR